MTFLRNASIWGFVICLSVELWSTTAVGQQISSPGGADPWSFSSIIQQASSLSGSRQQVFLSIDEAINVALQNNLDISIEQFTPEVRKEEITKAESAFDSNTNADLTYTFQESQQETSPDGLGNLELGIGKRFSSGGSYELGIQLGATAFSGTTLATVRDPETGNLTQIPIGLQNQYNNALELKLAQPVLRNFGTDVNTTQINIARKNRNISLSQLRETVIDVVSQVKSSYWNLVNALADLNAKRLALELAYNLIRINEAQVEVGTLAPIDVLQAKAQAASREVDVTTAELTVLNAEDQLKRLFNFAEDDPVWEAAIVPNDAPTEERYSITLEESIRTALANREELKQLQQSVEIQEISLNFSENQLQPELNLIGAAEVIGNAQEFTETFSEFGSLNQFNVTLGANFGYPIGNRSAKSDFNKTRLQLDQTRLSQRNVEQLISVGVRVAHRNVKTAFDLIGATRVARELSQEQLDAEQKKYKEGLSTNFQVLDFQDKLTQARTREALAITAYNQSLVNLDKAIGITLQRHNIVIKE